MLSLRKAVKGATASALTLLMRNKSILLTEGTLKKSHQKLVKKRYTISQILTILIQACNNYFELNVSPTYNKGCNNFNTDYVVKLIKLCRRLEDKQAKGSHQDNECLMEVHSGYLPSTEDILLRQSKIKVVSVGTTLTNAYPFEMVVTALSDIHKRPEWDETIDGLQVFQNFATNGFIYRTRFAPVTKVTLPEDSIEK